MDNYDFKEPCCAAEAMRRIRRVNVGGVTVGLSMLDTVFEEVATLKLFSDDQLQKELLRRVKIYNYVPSVAENDYAEAIIKEYRKRA